MCDSDLYLRYILGEVPVEQLHLLSERTFAAIPRQLSSLSIRVRRRRLRGEFAKEFLDASYVAEQKH